MAPDHLAALMTALLPPGIGEGLARSTAPSRPRSHLPSGSRQSGLDRQRRSLTLNPSPPLAGLRLLGKPSGACEPRFPLLRSRTAFALPAQRLKRAGVQFPACRCGGSDPEGLGRGYVGPWKSQATVRVTIKGEPGARRGQLAEPGGGGAGDTGLSDSWAGRSEQQKQVLRFHPGSC